MLPLPILVAIVLFLLQRMGFWGDVWSFDGPWFPHARHGASVVMGGLLVALGVTWFLLPLIQSRTSRAEPSSRAFGFREVWEALTLIVGLAAAGALLLYCFPAAYRLYAHLLLELTSWFTTQSPDTFVLQSGTITTLLAGVLPLVLGGLGYVAKMGWLKKLIANLFILSGPLFYILVIFYAFTQLHLSPMLFLPTLIITTLALLWSVYFVNLNMLSPHRYYRGRLCECYLTVPRDADAPTFLDRLFGRFWGGYVPKNEKGFTPVKQLPFHQLGKRFSAPYHLINAIVNLPASKNRKLRGRAGDFFVFTKDYCGAAATGYVATEELTRADPRLDVGTAVAISGAAASPNMGWRSLPQFRFLMTLFNVRLGYWIPNFRLKKGQQRPIPRRTLGMPYLLAEMIGRIQENMAHLNISDCAVAFCAERGVQAGAYPLRYVTAGTTQLCAKRSS